MNQGGLKVTMLLRLPGFSNPAIAKLLVQLGYTRLSHFIRAIPEVVARGWLAARRRGQWGC